jgi:hypothetical protein
MRFKFVKFKRKARNSGPLAAPVGALPYLWSSKR